MFDNTWALAGITMALIFFVFGLIFAVMKEKGAILIAGYNTKSKEERSKFDEKQMSKDMRNLFFIYGLIFLIGAVGTYIWGEFCFWISFFVWLLYFFKNLHFNLEKAFGKYRNHD